MRNNRLLILLTIIVALACVYLLSRKPKYLSQLEQQWGVGVTKGDVKLISEHENWEGRGEGFYFAEFKINDITKFKKLFVEKKFEKLPLKVNLPINEISNYTNEKFKEGFYLLKMDKQDFRDFNLLMINNMGHVILYYQDY